MAQDKSKITLNLTLLISFVTENANRANSKYITNNWQKSTIDQNIWKNNSKYGKKTKVRTMKIKVTVIQIQEAITNAASPLKKPLKTSNFMWMYFINMRYFNFELILGTDDAVLQNFKELRLLESKWPQVGLDFEFGYEEVTKTFCPLCCRKLR